MPDPDFIPAEDTPDFMPYEEPKQAGAGAPTLSERLSAAYHHPGQAIIGAAKHIPALFEQALPLAGTKGDVPGIDTSGKMKSPAVENAYNKVAGIVSGATTPKGDAEQGGADIATAASFIRPAYEVGKAIPIDRLTKAALGAGKGALEHVPIVGPITKGAVRGAIEGWRSAAPAAPAIEPAVTSEARTMPGQIAPERIFGPRPTPAQPLPARPGLLLKGESAPAAPAIDTSSQKLQSLLEQSMGGRKLEPAIPLKEQGASPGVKPAIQIPEGHVPVESSAVRSFRYDSEAREFHAYPTSGNTVYVYGDVPAEEAQAFENAASKGKAWQVIRRNPLVAKIVNGKRIAVKPVGQQEDLTDVLKKSVEQAKSKAKPIS